MNQRSEFGQNQIRKRSSYKTLTNHHPCFRPSLPPFQLNPNGGIQNTQCLPHPSQSQRTKEQPPRTHQNPPIKPPQLQIPAVTTPFSEPSTHSTQTQTTIPKTPSEPNTIPYQTTAAGPANPKTTKTKPPTTPPATTQRHLSTTINAKKSAKKTKKNTNDKKKDVPKNSMKDAAVI
ncbi:hypothetical protein L1887_32571 [Cichorium endivia]|nr:hypothetical protein L1887_32571 [Cichorium endivia]